MIIQIEESVQVIITIVKLNMLNSSLIQFVKIKKLKNIWIVLKTNVNN